MSRAEGGRSAGPHGLRSSSWARPSPPTPLAVLARVAGGADAVVLVRLRVDARAPVGAGVVAAAVVQVWGAGRALRAGTPGSAPSRPRRAPGLPTAHRPPPTALPARRRHLCCRAGRPSWSRSCTARAPRSCRVRSRGTGRTRRRTAPASRSCTWGSPRGPGPGGWGGPGAVAAVGGAGTQVVTGAAARAGIRPLIWSRPGASRGDSRQQPRTRRSRPLARTVGAAVQSLLPELFWDLPLSGAPGAGAGKGSPAGTPGTSADSAAPLRAPGLAGQRVRTRAPAAQLCAQGTAHDLAWNPRAVISLPTEPHGGSSSQGVPGPRPSRGQTQV